MIMITTTTTTTTTEHVIAQCSSLFESTNHGRHNKVTNIIHQQTVVKNKLLDRNILQYYRYKPESVLESANKIFYWNRSIINDKTLDFNRPHIMLIERQNKTALLTDVAVPFDTLPCKTETEKNYII
jgi:hypothetical protein